MNDDVTPTQLLSWTCNREIITFFGMKWWGDSSPNCYTILVEEIALYGDFIQVQDSKGFWYSVEKNSPIETIDCLTKQDYENIKRTLDLD